MRSSLLTSNKGFVLYPFILIFLFIVMFIDVISVNLFQRIQESKNSIKLDEFSLVELYTLKQVKDQFLTFNPKNFNIKVGEWDIKIEFIEETAYIVYQGPTTVSAFMIYDTVFKNVLEYQINDSSDGNSD